MREYRYLWSLPCRWSSKVGVMDVLRAILLAFRGKLAMVLVVDTTVPWSGRTLNRMVKVRLRLTRRSRGRAEAAATCFASTFSARPSALRSASILALSKRK